MSASHLRGGKLEAVLKPSIFAMGLLAQLAMVSSVHAADRDTQRITVNVPVYVVHFKERNGPREWNEGFANNVGAFLDYSREVWTISDKWAFRLGATAGIIKNSIDKSSVFGGGLVEFEYASGKNFSHQVGIYFGQSTGYGDGLRPVLSPYVGANVDISKDTAIGTRLHLLPGAAPTAISTVGLTYRF